MASTPNVVVTGLGALTPVGGDVPSTMRALLAGERGVGPLELFALAGAKSTLAAEVKDLQMDGVAARTDAMAVRAAREAIAMASIDRNVAARTHMVVGGTTAGMFETEELLTRLSTAVLDQELSIRLKTHPLSSTMDVLVEAVGPFASARTVCCACTSGVAALALAWSWIRSGRAEIVLAGGADALCRLTYGGFGSLAVLDKDACRPFDVTRAGLNLGEGAGFLVLESELHAQARGVTPVARLLSVALGGEAHHITNPEPGGRTAAVIMRRALAAASLEVGDVGYINAHGTATPHNDAAESAGIRACFEGAAPRVSSSKGQIGHTLGAAGAIEAIITAHAVQTGRLPPTIGLSAVDPACELRHVVASEAVALPLVALSNSFGFGGTGGTAVLASMEFVPNTRALESVRMGITGAAVVARGALLVDHALAELLVPRVSHAQSAAEVKTQPVERGEDPTLALDSARARRMDRAGKLSALVTVRALEAADAESSTPCDRASVAAVSGTAFGNIDGSMRFMQRMLEKGAQFASPVDFPNLVPSSPVSHAAIYAGLRGPALATPDLSATAESAMATGLELIAGGVSRAAVVGSVEEVSDLAERVLAPLLGVRTMSAHSEGASALVIERLDDALARGKRVSAVVRFWCSSRDAHAARRAPPPRATSFVVAEPNVDLRALLSESPWSGVEQFTLAPRAGEHVGLGGVALAACAARLAASHGGSALVVGSAPGRSYAFLLESSE